VGQQSTPLSITLSTIAQRAGPHQSHLRVDNDPFVVVLYNQPMLQKVATAELVVCWLSWIFAFVTVRKRAAGEKKVVSAPASLWGIALVAIGFFCVGFRLRPVEIHKSPVSLVLSMLLAPVATALAWAATRHLGKQWRYEAALSEDHDLIQTGPYALIRHPIYASMLGILLAAGFCLTWWPMFLLGLVFFVLGTEIRIRAEEGLLAGRFGDTYATYRARTFAYIPYLR
jgi:protein-S-isoprenylcysteine O-methyltransferase Ste14